MNKKLLAVAIASALAAPLAMADEGNVTISGNVTASVVSAKTEFTGDRATDVSPGGSDLSISGFENLGNGLKAVFLIKSWLNVTGNPGGGSGSGLLLGNNKDAYVGLAGNFGTVALGAHGQPYKTATGGLELFGDTIGDPRGSVTNAGGNLHSGIGDAVIWFLPNMNGFSGHIQYGAENGVDGGANPWGAQFNYSNGPFYATLAHADDDGANFGLFGIDITSTKLGASYAFGDTKLVGTYEWTDADAVGDFDAYSLGVAHSFGANTVKLQYAANTASDLAFGVDDMRLWSVGLDHALSKRTKLFALYADGEDITTIRPAPASPFVSIAPGIDNGFEVGIAHSF